MRLRQRLNRLEHFPANRDIEPFVIEVLGQLPKEAGSW